MQVIMCCAKPRNLNMYLFELVYIYVLNYLCVYLFSYLFTYLLATYLLIYLFIYVLLNTIQYNLFQKKQAATMQLKRTVIE
jgi:hypothetical protein